MIKWLFIHIKLLIQIIIEIPLVFVLAIKTLITRIKTGYYKKPHFKKCMGIYGKFGSGKGVFTIHYVRKILKKYKNCNYRILSNMTFNMDEWKPLGMTPEKFKFFTNVDDIDWLLETKVDAKGKEVPAYDFAIFIIDELPSVASNRDIMNSKKGKGVVTKDFLGLLHQLRKLNCLVITQFQDDAIDIAFRRVMDNIYVPHMHCLDRMNIVNIYNPRSLFAYLEDPNSPIPEYLNKFSFVCTDAVFNSYDTHQLVRSLAEGDYFRAGDKDMPTYMAGGSTIFSAPNNRKSLTQKLLGNKNI